MRTRTRIIATLGPASNNYSVLGGMMRAGLDVVRLNFSHGDYAQHGESIRLVGELNERYRRHLRIMQDLEGFRIRVGRFTGAGQRELRNRKTVLFTNEPSPRGGNVIPIDYPGELDWIEPGQSIYIDDGNIILKAKGRDKGNIEAEVIEGGILAERKGMNFPGAKMPFDGMTEKDKADIQFGIEHEVDFVCLSFVRNKRDVTEAMELIKPARPTCTIVAKIENREAITNIDEIIEGADGIMVARGDMGIAVPIYKVPMIQKRIIRKCNEAGKPVVTATQMLEHMTEHSRPTRAEVTDVANAIIDGTDYVMLSGESAVGKHPVKCVEMMNQIIKHTEKSLKEG